MGKTTLFNKVIGKKVDKEQVMREIESGRENLNQLNEKRAQLLQNRNAIENAILVLEGSLILDPKNKADLTKKEQFINKVEQIKGEVQELNLQISDQQAAIENLTEQHKELIEEDYLQEHNELLKNNMIKYLVGKKLDEISARMQEKYQSRHNENFPLYAKFGIQYSEIESPKAREMGAKVEKLRKASEEEVESKVAALIEQIEELLEEI